MSLASPRCWYGPGKRKSDLVSDLGSNSSNPASWCVALSEFFSPRLSSLIPKVRRIMPVSKRCWEGINEATHAKRLVQCLVHREHWMHLAIIIIMTAIIALVSFMELKIKRTGQVNPYNDMLKYQEIVNAILYHQSSSLSPSIFGAQIISCCYFLVWFPPYFTLSCIPQNLTQCYMHQGVL